MRKPKPDFDWQAPDMFDSARNRMGWVDEMVQESESWLKGQVAYKDIPQALDLISGKRESNIQSRSELNTNHAKYAIRKIVATLADVRDVALYGSDANYYSSQAELLNNVARAVYEEGEFPRKLRQSLQYMSATAKGYIWPKYKRANYGFGEGRIYFEPLGLLDVLPVQLPADNNIQGSYIATVILFTPVAEAHAKFPAFQSSLLPVAKRRYDSSVSARRLDLAERFKYGDSGQTWSNLYCEIRYTFIRDIKINTTGQVIPMGEEGTSWYYPVPSVGMDIPDVVDASGVRSMKKAQIEDCLLYPNLRLIITSKGMREPMYDGPAFDWHGEIPLAEYCCDDWPWEACGYSLTHDIYSIERSRQRLERGVDQVAQARLDPAMGFDRTSGLNDKTAKDVDPFEPRMRVGVDGEIDKVFKSLLPEHLLEVPGFVMEAIQYLRQCLEGQLGLNDIGNVANMKANVNSPESFDKAVEMIGPLAKDIMFGMETSNSKVAYMLKFLIPQYYTTKRIMQYTGPGGITAETLDFDPDSLVPSHSPDEKEAGFGF